MLQMHPACGAFVSGLTRAGGAGLSMKAAGTCIVSVCSDVSSVWRS